MQLLQIEVGGIQQYIFEGARLREWRGASALLDKAEREDLPEAIAEHNGVRILRQGGGVVVLEIQADGPSPERVVADVERCYRKTAPGTSVSSSHASLDSSDVQETLARLTFRTTANRDRAPGFDDDVALLGAMVRPCGSCGTRPAEESSEIADDGTLLCSVCKTKARHGRRVRNEQMPGSLLERFSDHLEEAGSEAVRSEERTAVMPEHLETAVPEDLGAIAEAGSGSVALIQADGNSLGKTVQQIATREQYRALSTGIASAVESAVFDTLAACGPESGVLPWEVIFLGGDDVLIATSADIALEVARGLTHRVEENTAALFQESPLDEVVGRPFMSMGTGVVVADPHVPMAVLRKMAHDLEQSAKDRTYALREGGSAQEVSTLDFHRLTGSGSASLSYVRDYALRPRRSTGFAEVSLTQRPFTLGELEDVVAVAEAWEAASVPNNKLHALRESLFESPAAAMQQWTHVVARASEGEREAWHRLRGLTDPTRGDGDARPDDVEEQMPYQVKTTDAPSRRAETPLLDVIDVHALLN